MRKLVLVLLWVSVLSLLYSDHLKSKLLDEYRVADIEHIKSLEEIESKVKELIRRCDVE